ncbi:MAG: amino acid ABC transporter permease [Propionicimonas sp.]|nr:amino acid ABC transporter permease [Propionicimonas sp.]
MDVLWTQYAGTFASGLGITLYLTLLSFGFAMVLGTIIAAFRISPIAPLRAVGLVYVEIFRNIPLMSLIIVVVYALPEIEILLDYNTAIIVSMSLVGGSFVCEALRTGINGVDAGQIEAARAIGLGFVGVLRYVVFPQAFRSMVQPFVTILIAIFLSSSLAGVVGVMDLTQTVSYINNRESLGLITFGVAAVVYSLISLGIATLGARLETRARVLR